MRFRDHLDQSVRLLTLSVHGISVLVELPELDDILAEGKTDEDEEHKRRREQTREAAALARAEVEQGFPLLHSQAVVSLWSSLEDCIRTFLAKWLANEPGAKQVDAVGKLKITVGDYEAQDDDERDLYLIELLERDKQSPRRSGVSRFESMLEPFGLAGAVDDDVAKTLFEMHQVRHVLVHRAGLADRRFAAACPWLGLSAGEPVVIREEEFGRYMRASVRYIVELIQRIRGHFGMRRFDFEKGTEKRG